VLELAFQPDRESREPVYRQLGSYLRDLIDSRRLPPAESAIGAPRSSPTQQVPRVTRWNRAALSYAGTWTAQGGVKPATLETGAVVRVPLFVEEGETIKVDTRTGEYVSRVKD